MRFEGVIRVLATNLEIQKRRGRGKRGWTVDRREREGRRDQVISY